MTPPPLHLVGIAGSLRADSFNRSLLRAAVELAPDGLEIEPFELDGIPLYNQDLDTDDARPAAVTRLKEAIGRADGVLVATPEYNYGMPGVLKNALDWASRPAYRSPMYHTPVGVMGASKGGSGTLRAQEQLKLALLGMAALPFPERAVAVTRAGEKIDDEGRLVDDRTRGYLSSYLEKLEAWIRGS